MLLGGRALAQESLGSIRGVVLDRDFDAPLPLARVTIVETGQEAATGDQGNYVLGEVVPGTYTLVFAKEGYVREVTSGVVVGPGRLTEVNASLSGDFTEMEEFVVEDVLQLAAGTEAALLELRFESPALLDSISADLMSRAGASDAASALRLVAGATVQDGKFAVIRGLPDRYVSSQLNGVRLPSADEKTRAVELDQFPAPVIESIQVSKTFTPDQQGDASGGAVDVRLKRIPEENVLELKGQVGLNSQVSGSDFLTYEGGGLDFWGSDDGGRDIQFDNLGGNWDGAVGVRETDPPIDSKWSAAAGGKLDLDNGVRIGGLVSLFYERDSGYYDDGENNALWEENPGDGLSPEKKQQTGFDDFKTALFDVTESSQLVQWGGLATVGLETENNALGLTYLYTRTTEDVAILAEDTRGKEFFFPGYDPDDPSTPGHDQPGAAPYIRTETLEYTERVATSLQLYGEHLIPMDDVELGDVFAFRSPEVSWTVAHSTAGFDQPDKRLFGALWIPEREIIPGFTIPALWAPFKPAANINLGSLQRIFKSIDERSEQYVLDLKLPFEQWTGDEGYVQVGYFDDSVDRRYRQDTFSNAGDEATFEGDFDDFWSESFPDEDHPIFASEFDVDYDGDQDIRAYYGMLDLPLFSWLNVVGGARFESTDIQTRNDPDENATWFPPGEIAPIALDAGDSDADVMFSEDEVLPALGLVYRPHTKVTVRASYAETVARQTFRELTPILQQEFLGGPIFIGNPDLVMSNLKNYDLRLDYTPYQGGLVSLSYFFKDVEDAIEFVQRTTSVGFTFTTPVNYPEGELSGYEVEIRQDLGRFWEGFQGLSVGGNATFIDSELTLPDDEAALFADPDIARPMATRDATGAPEYLYNLYATYDLELTGTQFGIFYTVRGDTLVAGASATNNFIPNVYEEEYGTLNASITQRLGDHWSLKLQAKNITNPEIREVYRSDFIEGDGTRSSFTRGIDFSIGLTFRP